MSIFRPWALAARVLAVATCCIASSSILAHEFWIEPQEFQVESGQPVIADLKNGQNFSGSEFAWFDKRIIRFDQIMGSQTQPVTGRAGDMPAVTFTPTAQGLLVLVHETAASTLTYATWEKFQAFITHKAFEGAGARHTARNLPMKDFEEGYTRYVKALIGVGHSKGQDTPTGLQTEIVALANPYTDDITGGLPVQVLYRKIPRANAQIEVFERNPDLIVTTFLRTTDAQGMAVIPVKPGFTYLLDAVILRDPILTQTTPKNIVWETLWAALTFQVPD